MCNDKYRKDFLLKMYDQMFNDINRHIIVIWQSVGVLVGAFAIFALVEKEIISIDIATTVILMLTGWLFAHIIDASYWYNRNLAIIANIEKEFLIKEDLHDIHYYFGSHRPKNRMIYHLKIQFSLGILISFLVLIFHFFKRVLPGIGLNWSNFEFLRSLPYLFALIIFLYLLHLRRNRLESFEEFVKNSPGKTVDTTGIEYGTGHGFKSKDKK